MKNSTWSRIILRSSMGLIASAIILSFQAFAQQANDLFQRMSDSSNAAANSVPGGTPAIQSLTQIMPDAVYFQAAVNSMSPYIQNDLKLGLQYTYIFTLYVRAMNDNARTASVPDGWYSMDMAVVLPEVAPEKMQALLGKSALTPYDRFITHVSKIVNVNGGKIVQEATLRFPNLTATTVTNYLYVQLTPLETACKDQAGQPTACIQFNETGLVDENKSQKVFKPGYFSNLISVPFVPTFTSGGGNAPYKGKISSPNPDVDKSLKEYNYHALIYRAEQKSKSITKLGSRQYAHDNKLKLVSIEDPLLTRTDPAGLEGRSPKAVIRELLDMTAGTLGPVNLPKSQAKYFQYICSLLLATNSKPQIGIDSLTLLSYAETCQINASDVFRLSVLEHIQSFDPRGVRLVEDITENFSTGSSFGLSRSDSETFSRSVSFNPLEPVFRILDIMGAPLRALGLNVSFSYSVSDSRSATENSGNWLGVPLDFRILKIEIPVTQSQRCLEISVIPRKDSVFYNKSGSHSKGLYICDKLESRPHKVNEVYANIYSTTGMDSFNPGTQPFNMTLQGDRDLSTFFYFNRHSMTANHNNEVNPISQLEKARTYFAMTPHSNPGMIATPLGFPSETVPSLKSLMTGTYRERFK